MRSHGYRNSHRADLAPRPGFVPHKSGRRSLSPREMAAQRGGRPAYSYDGGAGGRAVVEPVCWLIDWHFFEQFCLAYPNVGANSTKLTYCSGSYRVRLTKWTHGDNIKVEP